MPANGTFSAKEQAHLTPSAEKDDPIPGLLNQIGAVLSLYKVRQVNG